MRFGHWLTAACALLLLSTGIAESARAGSRPRVALILHDNVALYRLPSSRSQILTALVQQTQVEVVGRRGAWDRVLVWTSVPGWVRQKDVTYRKPWSTVSTYRAPEIHYHLQAHGSRAIQVSASTASTVGLYGNPGGQVSGSVPAGHRVTITAWQQDANGVIWYRIGRNWARGDSIQFAPTKSDASTHGSPPIWSRVAGKGMWLTLGTVSDSSADALVTAALRAGMTHVYVESAISPLGFHGRRSVGHLLAAAHRHHLAVIAWVYPYLYDVAADVDLTAQVASFHTASGERFDGIAADLERNMTLSNVRAYSQLVRTAVGPHFLLVGVTYPPQALPAFPFAEVARNDNVIAPMDYWHDTTSTSGLDFGHMAYGYTYGYRYGADSIAAIRRAAGAVPVAPIGQTFDNFGRLEMGPHAPSGSEIRGFLEGTKSAGAAGVSFFQWMTTTDDEWHEIRSFHFPSRTS